MRFIALLAALLGVAVAVLVVAGRDEGSESGKGTVALVGDSLNVGVEPYLPGALRGWKVVANDQAGRQTEEGIVEIEQGRARLAPHVVVSLGTNDAPDAVDTFREQVGRVTKLVGPNRCLVWATIWRDGAPSDAFNEVLHEAASANARMRVVEWAEMVRTHSDWLADDGLHGNATGYRKRAEAIAAAIRDCAPEQRDGER